VQNKRYPLGRSYINDILDKQTGTVEEWLNTKELLEAEAIAADGMREADWRDYLFYDEDGE
jgi:hypothetical protein